MSSDYTEARQAVRNVLREIGGYSPEQVDILVDTLTNFFAVNSALTNAPAGAPLMPDARRIEKSQRPSLGRSPAA
jgi:hypothetical protein